MEPADEWNSLHHHSTTLAGASNPDFQSLEIPRSSGKTFLDYEASSFLLAYSLSLSSFLSSQIIFHSQDEVSASL